MRRVKFSLISFESENDGNEKEQVIKKPNLVSWLILSLIPPLIIALINRFLL